MTRLFEAGFVERFRPQTLRGSYQWAYCLARDGFPAAEQTGELAPGLKFAPRREAILDYRYVIHDLRTNEWVLRYRELLFDRLLDWAGPDESRFEPPKKSRDDAYMSRATAVLGDCGRHAYDVPDEWFRPVQPDAVLDVAAANRDAHVLVGYDRTRRVDKNFTKFLRYDTLLTVWWRATDLQWPFVVFVCQDAEHRRRFMQAADFELIGHLGARTERGYQERFHGRDRTLFALEDDIRNDDSIALRLPALPPCHEHRPSPATVRRSTLPGLEA
jgi:hypothetical protein